MRKCLLVLPSRLRALAFADANQLMPWMLWNCTVATSTDSPDDAAASTSLDFGRRDSMGGGGPSLPPIPEDENSDLRHSAASGALDNHSQATATSASADLGTLCAEEDQATLSHFMQISHTIAEAQAAADLAAPVTVDLDPALVNILQRCVMAKTHHRDHSSVQVLHFA